MIKAVIYDLDGTLVDSRQDLADSVNAMLARLGLPQHEDRIVWTFIGEGAERLIRRALGLAHELRYPEAAQVWKEEYALRLLAKTRPYAGIAALLDEPPAARAVLTNKPGGFAREILRGLKLDERFLAVLGGDEGPRKPLPDGFEKLCARLSVAPSEALMVGDSNIDLATARAAAAPCCAVTWGLGERASMQTADYICDAPADLARLLRRLTRGDLRT